MYSVLIDALFTSSPDYERLFESLCWPAESWPETERVKALTAFIQGLEKLFADPDKTSLSAAQRRRIQDKVESTVPRRVAVSVLPSLQVSEEEALNVDVSIEVMAALIPSLSEDENITIQILSTVLSCIKTLPVAQVSKATVRLLLTLLNCCSSGRSSSIIKSIQDDLCSWYCSNGTSVVTERVLLCLTVLSDHLLTPSSSSNCNADPRLSHQFWRIIQDGLTHKDSVSRKRALYLLKRCVALSEEESMECSLSPMNEGESALFKWAPGKGKLLREFWEDYVLVMETLEENQVHVVRPVLNRIDTLIQTTVNDGQGLIHPSWLLCVYQRMFHSENKSLMREGVCHLLELQNLKLLYVPEINKITTLTLYINHFFSICRSVGQNNVGDCPELGAKLQVFLANFFCSLPSHILLQLIQQLGCKHWCAVPLLFLCQALSKLSPSPLLGRDGFTALREVLRCTMITHQVLLRGASAVSLDDVFSFLTHFRADESLCRGTQLWTQVCDWLSENEGGFSPSAVDADQTGQTDRLPDPKEAEKLARSVLLCVDVEHSRSGADITNTLELLLSPLLDTLSRVSTNIYLPLRKSDKSLQLVLQLFQLGQTPGERAVAMAALARVCGLVEQEVVAMRSETGSALKTLNDYLSRRSKHSIYHGLSLYNRNTSFQYIVWISLYSLCSDDEVHGPLLKDWGRIAANFMRDQWVCLSFLVKTFGIPENSRTLDTVKAALSRSVDALALLPNDLVLPVLTFMETILPQLLTDEEELCVEAVTQSWELVQGLTSNANDFWSGLKGFVSMAFNPQLLQLSHGQALKFTSTLKKLIELSQSKSGVFGVLLHHCSQTWMPTGLGGSDHADAVFSSVFSHIHILTEACVYGPVFRRDQRLIQDVQTYVEQLGEESSFAANLIIIFFFSSSFQDNDLSRSKVRAYSNSLQHRVKNRVWQTLLLLLPKLRDDFVTTSLTHVFEAGYYSNQASVKYLIEWMMILILIRYPQHMDSFWACFNMDHEKTKTSVCTYLSVLVHFDIILPHLEDQVKLSLALDIILQWCFNHNFSVRLYALLALKRVWQLAAVQAEGVTDGLGGLSTVIKACLNQAEAMQNTGNANKNWIRIQEHFFFGAFHPVEDYSAETIFYTFPSLSEVADDEWIPLWKFEKLLCFSECSSLPLKNPSLRLSQLQSGDWIQQDKSTDKEERWAEVQKKITPWRLEVQEQEPELSLVPSQRAARLGKSLGALLVVASLIDKPTNLGGLCRTCEIFGASALVLDNLRHINDKNFQSLSVSSELWLPLLEVKPVELSDFLQQKKSEGYCIVGVEQTANSQSLDIYRFPEKTLLLLGNEREGIPANLLQLLDVCVEIPQQGVIRSLNVHVSAALLIWEYTRQHLSSGSS
uniref:tRNA (guanosine(18)-2'-O)-methyltransferase TARBP1 n=1 Tax=Cynoglossus semilaevis TaxID=244447 RepID=A0A3P8V522_CYNSE